MGQRHQAFIIARVVPHGSSTNQAKYRCIAAYHHQWCYGTLPLRAAHRFLTLAKQPDNAEVIRAEVRAIHGKYGRRGEKPKIVDTPCPFVATLLGEAWTTGGMGEPDNEDPPYSSGITLKWGLLEVDMGMWDGDNNDGITIIDVTDPAAPAYCFHKDMGGRCLSAEGYVRSYYPVPSGESLQYPRERNEEQVLVAISALDGEKLIMRDMLVEAWGKEKPPPANEAQPTVAVSIPALADISLEAVLTHGLRESEMAELEKFLWLPGKAEQIRTFLCHLSPFPEHAVPFLAKALAELDKIATSASLDLSEFDLTGGQILQLLSSLPTDLQAKLEGLNLSFNSHIACNTIKQILALESLPALNRLVLIGCPSISELDLSTLLSTSPRLFYKLDALLHPLTLSVREPPIFPATFTYLASFSNRSPNVRGITLPVFTPARLLQNLLDYFTQVKKGFMEELGVCSGMAAQSVFSSKHQPGQRWAERSVVSVPVVSLDTLIGGDQEGWLCLYVHEPQNVGFKFAFVRRKTKPARSEAASAWAAGGQEQETDTEIAASAGGGEAKTSHESRREDPQQVSDFEILDVRGFVEALVAEGRPAPPEELVTRLADLLAKKSEEGKKKTDAFTAFMRAMSGTQTTVPELEPMEDADILQFVDNARRFGFDEQMHAESPKS